ncbi:hypothetical protein YC2023_023628 [Brassica napus]
MNRSSNEERTLLSLHLGSSSTGFKTIRVMASTGVDEPVLDASWYMPDDPRISGENIRVAHIPGPLFFDLDRTTSGLHRLGETEVPVYDGSWTEWATEPDLPMEGEGDESSS